MVTWRYIVLSSTLLTFPVKGVSLGDNVLKIENTYLKNTFRSDVPDICIIQSTEGNLVLMKH